MHASKFWEMGPTKHIGAVNILKRYFGPVKYIGAGKHVIQGGRSLLRGTFGSCGLGVTRLFGIFFVVLGRLSEEGVGRHSISRSLNYRE